MKKITALLVALILICSALLVGCNGCNGDDPTGQTVVPDTDIVVFDGKKSEYKIVIPENATEYETFASEELITFFEQATGVKLEVITDSGLTFSENDKYFSLGRTSLLASTDITVSVDELGNDGYKAIRKGNTLFICGGAGFGTIYGVYKFLEEAVGWLPLAPDEIIVHTVPRLYMPDFNLTDIPDLAYRTGGHYVTAQNERLFAMRSRTFAGHGYSMFQEDIWGIWAHTHFSLLPTGTHLEAHPEWYSPDARQLCLSNSEMRTAMVESIKKRVLSRTTSELYMVGQEDSATFCNCEACTANIEAIGDLNGTTNGANSALMMDFINDIATQIEEWRKETCPDRKILIGTFAYQRTEAPPVKKNESTGEYESFQIPATLKDSVKDSNGQLKNRSVSYNTVDSKDNVFVLIAPIYADWASPINDPDHNSSTKVILEGWHATSEKLALWTYCNNFSMTLEYFDNVNNIATNYKVYQDLGAFYLYDESGQSTKANMMFQTMMGYINSELMWDNQQSVDDLITNFINGYYKEAAVPMRKLFDSMRNYFTMKKTQWAEEEDNYVGTGIWLGDASKAELKKSFWQLGVLEQMIAYCDEAHAIIDKAPYTDAEKETMHLRITQESLTPRMYMLQLFASDIEKDTYLNMIDEFEADMSALGLSKIFGSKTLAQTTAEWRANKI